MKHTHKSTTHWACDPQIKKYGGQTKCCACMEHNCQPIGKITEARLKNGKIEMRGTLYKHKPDHDCQADEVDLMRALKPEEWEEEFDKKFKDAALIYPKAFVEDMETRGLPTTLDLKHFDNVGLGNIKGFISDLLKREHKGIVGELWGYPCEDEAQKVLPSDLIAESKRKSKKPGKPEPETK